MAKKIRGKHAKRWKVVLWLVGPMILFLSIWAYLNPLAVRDLGHMTELLRSGVRPFYSNLSKGYRYGDCDPTRDTTCKCVVMLHGLGDQALGWRNLLQEITLRPDLKKHLWLSVNLPMQSVQVSEMASDLRLLLRPMCSNWIVIGNSFGGWVASQMALKWSDGVTHLILMGSAGLKSSRTSQVRSYFSEPSVESLKTFLSKAYAHPRMDLDDKTLQMAVDRMKASPAKNVMESQTEIQFLDSRLHEIKQPTLLLWGEKDQIIPLSVANQMKSKIPNSELQTVLDCGHLPQKECPKITLAVMLDWIQRFSTF